MTERAILDPWDPLLAEQIQTATGLTVTPGRVVACPVCSLLGPEGDPCRYCAVRAVHDADCPFRLAATCAIPIPCDPHEDDVCPICAPCTCADPVDGQTTKEGPR